MNVWRSVKIAYDDEGLCNKYDATCAERTDMALGWCSERVLEKYLKEEMECHEREDFVECEEQLLERFHKEIKACAGG